MQLVVRVPAQASTGNLAVTQCDANKGAEGGGWKGSNECSLLPWSLHLLHCALHPCHTAPLTTHHQSVNCCPHRSADHPPMCEQLAVALVHLCVRHLERDDLVRLSGKQKVHVVLVRSLWEHSGKGGAEKLAATEEQPTRGTCSCCLQSQSWNRGQQRLGQGVAGRLGQRSWVQVEGREVTEDQGQQGRHQCSEQCRQCS